MRTQRAEAVRDDRGMWLVERPRLITRLDEAVRHEVTLIVAPAGYGKATALTQWTASRRGRTVRLSGRGLTPREVRARAGGGHDPVIVDDAHLASTDSIDALLDLLDGDRRLVLSGISRPPIPIGSLTARGQLTELVSSDLVFDRDEARALLETVGEVPESALDVIMETSLGWPAALRILSEQELSWDRERSQLARLYAFFDEVVHPLATEPERELLRTLATLPIIAPAAVVELTGDHDAYLSLGALADRGYPVIPTEAGLCLHPLIRRQFAEELAAIDPAGHQAIATKAIRWLADHGDTLSAIRLAVDSDAPLDAGPLLRRHFLDFLFTDPVRLRQTVQRCASRGQLAAWEVAAMQTAILAAGGEVAGELALNVLDELVEADDLDHLDHIRLAGFRLFIARSHAYLGMDLAPSVSTAEETCQTDIHSRETLPHLAFLQVERGLQCLYEGDLNTAHEWLVRGLTTARLADLRPVAVQALSGRAWVTARRGGVAAARRIADEAIMEAGPLALHEDTCLAELAVLAKAMVDIDIGDLEQADAHLAAQRRCCAVKRRETAAIVAQLEAMRCIMRGDLPGAVATVERAFDTLGPMLPMEIYMLAATASGALLISDDDRPAALRWIELCEEVGRPEFGGSAHLRAHYLMRLGRFNEAFDLLEPIVRHGHVAVEKEWLQLLMAFALAADRSGRTDLAASTFTAADELANRIGMGTPRGRQNLGTVERRARVRFTDAERHLLRNLTADETIRQLADRLFVSHNTVKTHLRRIYTKLGVSSREEAIERARVLRLL